MKAVLHEIAKSSENGTWPPSSPSKFLNVRPPTVIVFGQATLELGSKPRRRRAAVVMTLKVEPGA